MVGGEALFRLAFGIVVDDELDRVEHGDAAQRGVVQYVALAGFEDAVVDPAVGFRHADLVGETAETFGGVAAAARTDQGGRRGSSQPETCFSSTSWISLRLESTTKVRMSRANSISCGSGRVKTPPSES